MSSLARIYVSDSYDPWLNLAMEDWIFHEMEDVEQVLFLWRNSPTVVIGRSQNPWVECKLDLMSKNGVKLARRQSGGGAVYHDLGNTNFTFLSRKLQYDKMRNLNIIIKALSNLGLESHCQGRNDLVVKLSDGGYRKISGSAFKEKVDKAFHHGTLLLDADLQALSQYLSPNKKKLVAKGVKSVRSRVINCNDIVPGLQHSQVCDAIVKQFNLVYGAHSRVETISPHL